MFLRPQGNLTISEPGNNREYDTFTCKHCGRITIVRPKQHPEDAGGFCGVCSSLVCKHCAGKGCDVLEKKLARLEARKSWGI